MILPRRRRPCAVGQLRMSVVVVLGVVEPLDLDEHAFIRRQLA